MKTVYGNVSPYVTKDGSTIRELMHPDRGHSVNQSLAEATVPPGCATLLHYHVETEEIYHITAGVGTMVLEDEEIEVAVGDSVLITPETKHSIKNSGTENLIILCCCSPAYSHEKTVIIES